MSPTTTRHGKKHAQARQRRRLTAQERLERDRRRAQQAAMALEHALHDWDLPNNLVKEIEGRLRRQQQLLGKLLTFQICDFSKYACGLPDDTP
jgi:hypothetical protein